MKITTSYHELKSLEEVVWKQGDISGVKASKRKIIREREVSYRFSSHFHPYVQKLMRRLLHDSTRGLQAADTDYANKYETLPGSVVVYLRARTALEIPADSNIALHDSVKVRVNGEDIQLSGNMELQLDADTKVAVPRGADGGVRATLSEGVPVSQEEGERFKLKGRQNAVICANAKVQLTAETKVKLYDGSLATLDVGTAVLLPAGTWIAIAEHATAVLLAKKRRPELFDEIFSEENYNPSKLVQLPYPVKDLDFTTGGAYSVYNWELFFHVPLTIAIHLSKNHRFAEAQQWFHYLFDPTDASDEPTPERFWKVRPFHSTHVRRPEELLVNLTTNQDPQLKTDTENCIAQWRDNPFRPHQIARFRQQAYMSKTVMAYLDNLIDWGDSLFRQDSGEAIDEAMMLYVLAANILGPRPQPVPKKGSVRPQTYAALRQDLDKFGNAMRDIELDLPFDAFSSTGNKSGDEKGMATIRSIAQALYFCVPKNDKLLSYWDTVADRLFKIRNSLNFQGAFRQLALFEPPIDPAMLARAAAAGLDVGAIVNGLNQPLPLVRFQLLVQKAAELVQEVKSLGNNLLSAMEKEDGEAMSLLRAKHERAVMDMVEYIKYGQLQEAIKSKEGLLGSLALAVQRYTFYERQLGKKADEISIPELDTLDNDSLMKMKFKADEPELGLRDIEVDISGDLLGGAAGNIISSHEANEIKLLNEAQKLQDIAAGVDVTASLLAAIPSIGVHATPVGVGAKAEFGGMHLHDIFSSISSGLRGSAGRKSFEANLSAKIGDYAHRERDWAFQSNLAAGEISQIFKQIRAAEIREAVAELELKNHRQQMKHAEEIEQFLNAEGTEKNGKKTNKALYTWMKREVKGLYGQCFQFAFDIAKKAERALQHELGNPDLSYLKFGYLSGKEGLLAGERLYLDIKRMEMAYHDLNQREYELTKHVSLLQVNPLALIQLRMTGRCTVELPEALFDMDGPGHYFRRIKNVAVSIPCVTGPYASVNCTLTLLKSSIRKTQTLLDGVYGREDAEDDRFSDYFGSLQSIVTSSAQNDSGLFETNLRDERYLPFENSGVISEWQLQLPADPSKNEPAQFDYSTITDVILHIRYTAREGGGLLSTGAMTNINELIEAAKLPGTTRLFSLRHEFPSEWSAFKNRSEENGWFELVLNFKPEHYPFWAQGRLNEVDSVVLLAQGESLQIAANADGSEGDPLQEDKTMGNLLFGKLPDTMLPDTPIGEMSSFFDSNELDDLFFLVTWSE